MDNSKIKEIRRLEDKLWNLIRNKNAKGGNVKDQNSLLYKACRDCRDCRSCRSCYH